MAALAQLPEGAHAGAARIARDIGAPPNYLGKLLQARARAGLVQSQKGLGGGFCLARDPRHISLFDVLEPLEHVSRWSGCILGRPGCSDRDPGAAHDRWQKVRNAYLDLLTRTSIADLVRAGEGEALLV